MKFRTDGVFRSKFTDAHDGEPCMIIKRTGTGFTARYDVKFQDGSIIRKCYASEVDEW